MRENGLWINMKEEGGSIAIEKTGDNILKNSNVHKGSLILVNSSNAFVNDGNSLLVPVKYNNNSVLNNSVLMEKRAATLLHELMKKIDGCGKIVPISGWRSLHEQQDIWEKSIEESGQEFTKKYVALPGHSEHHTGLAIDLGLKSKHIDFIRPDFPYEGICEKFRVNAADFGFIERYPAGKESITGISHEPWHFRYVGVPHAEIMTENGFVLEEYILFLKQFRYGKKHFIHKKDKLTFEIYFVFQEEEGEKGFVADDNMPYIVSGNNVDGFIVTVWGNV